MKNLLREKSNFDVLEGFLGALLKEEITVLELLESESNQEYLFQKFNRVDLLVKDKAGRKIIIEVQTEWESAYLERLLYGVSKKIVEHMKVGESFENISKIIVVSIQYFNLGKGNDYIYFGTTEFKGIHTGDPLIIKKKIENIVNEDERIIQYKKKDIFPEYYLINLEKFKEDVNDDLDEWVYAFKKGEVKDEFKSKNIEKLREKFSILKMDIKAKAKYEKYLILYAEEKDVLKTAHEEGIQKGMQKGRQEGIQEGIEKGMQKGIQEGIEKGRQEGIEKGQQDAIKSSVIAMLNEGLELNLIAKISQLSLLDIKFINQEHLAKM